MPMPAAARRSSALAPIPGPVRRGGGCGVEPSADDELLRREAAQAIEAGKEPEEDERKGAIVVVVIGDARVRREEAIDENAADDDLRSALAVAPREGLLLLPCIVERAATVARSGLCGAEAAGAEARGAEADDEILIDEKKEAAIDG